MKSASICRRWPITIFSSILLMSCSTTPEVSTDTPQSYLNTAEKNYREGEKAKKNKNYEEAVSYFQYVKNQYPYSQFAALADLAIAETYMDSEQWLQAAESFQFFVQFHPKHEKVPWATYQIAYAYTEAIPEDIPLMPKSYEKDQGATKSAIVAWDRFLRRFPKHEKVVDAKKNRTKAREILAEQEWAVAKHYEDKERFQGAAWRYETIFNLYPESDKARPAMEKVIQLYTEKLKEKEKASALKERLAREYPEEKKTENTDENLNTSAPSHE